MTRPPAPAAGGAQDEPEVLAAAAGALDVGAGHACGQVGRAGDVPPGDAVTEELHGGDGAADHVVGQAAPDDLDLGELGHGVSGVRSPRRRRDRGVGRSSRPAPSCAARMRTQACSAAFCSASFLVRPVPHRAARHPGRWP